MSYNLVLFAPRPGVDAREIALAEDGDGERGVRDPGREAAKRKIADALLKHDRQLEIFEFDYDEISKLHKMPVEQVYERFRHIEINDTANDGIQITLFDAHASITIPYWHKGAAARTVFARLWALIEVVCREGGYEVFDAQLDRVISASAFEDVLARYQGVATRMDDMIGRAPRKPWWKFW
ncbi:MAG: hypothetical protein KBA31_19660 [Alphaproteobacteria bacterium]|nr:hypothetical protein [Alphaproteobacteria bacterium]